MSGPSRRRPWLAVLLGLLVSGLGHAYLRRWGRALGWYAAITVTVLLLVPDRAIDALMARSPTLSVDIAPALVAVVASVVDAYVLAVRNNREVNRREREKAIGERAAATERAEASPDASDRRSGSASRSANRPSGADSAASNAGPGAPVGDGSDAVVECPHCGRETDPDLDFCHWCTEPLDGVG